MSGSVDEPGEDLPGRGAEAPSEEEELTAEELEAIAALKRVRMVGPKTRRLLDEMRARYRWNLPATAVVGPLEAS